ncbi:hypothetical protein ACROYT_G022132 [Oculina patagonica]
MAKQLLILLLIATTFCAIDTHEHTEKFSDLSVRKDTILREEHELFPRVCGMHGWKKCGRRRSAIKQTKERPEAAFNRNSEEEFEDF